MQEIIDHLLKINMEEKCFVGVFFLATCEHKWLHHSNSFKGMRHFHGLNNVKKN